MRLRQTPASALLNSATSLRFGLFSVASFEMQRCRVVAADVAADCRPERQGSTGCFAVHSTTTATATVMHGRGSAS